MLQRKTSQALTEAASTQTSAQVQRGTARGGWQTASPNSPLARGMAAREATTTAPPADLLAKLSREIRQLETTGKGAGGSRPSSSAGCEVLDALLPHAGYVPGSVVEYLRMAPACGASSLAWAAAAAAMQSTGGFLVVVDTGGHVYPPGLLCHGIPLNKVVFLRPQSQADALWSIDQALRTPAVAAVVAELERIDDRTARRLQLAAEKGAGLALLLRGLAARKQPSWAEVQWLVGAPSSAKLAAPLSGKASSSQAPLRHGGHRFLQVQLLRARGGKVGATVELQMDAATGRFQAIPTSLSEHHERKQYVPDVASAQQPDASNGPSSAGALHMAAQLARTTRRSTRAAAG